MNSSRRRPVTTALFLLVLMSAIGPAQAVAPIDPAATVLEPWRLPIADAKVVGARPWSIKKDPDGVLWLGLETRGLLRIDLNTEQHRRYTVADGLASNLIEQIVVDDHGRTWIRAQKGGINYFPPGSHETRRLTAKDGKAIYAAAIHQDREGRVWLPEARGHLWSIPAGTVTPQAITLPGRGEELAPMGPPFEELVNVPWGGVLLIDRAAGVGFYYIVPGRAAGVPLAKILPNLFTPGPRDTMDGHEAGSTGRPSADAHPSSAASDDAGTLLLLRGSRLVSCQSGFDHCRNETGAGLRGEPERLLEPVLGAFWLRSSNGLLYRATGQSNWNPLQSDQGASLKDCTIIRPDFLRYPLLACGKSRKSDYFMLSGSPFSGFHTTPMRGSDIWRDIFRRKPTGATDSVLWFDPELRRWTNIGDILDLLAGNTIRGELRSKSVDNLAVFAQLAYEHLPGTRVFGLHGLDPTTGTWLETPSLPSGHFEVTANGHVWAEEFRPGLNDIGTAEIGSDDSWFPKVLVPPYGISTGPFTVLEIDADLTLVATSQGLFECRRAIRQCEPSSLDGEMGSITTMHRAGPDGDIWLGGRDGSVCISDSATAQTCRDFFALPDTDGPSAVVTIETDGDQAWIGTTSRVFGYVKTNGAWQCDPARSIAVQDLRDIGIDRQGRLWLLHGLEPPDDFSTDKSQPTQLSLYARGPEKPSLLGRMRFDGRATLPDADGSVWIAAADGVARQTWYNGVPGRRELIPFADDSRWLGQVVPLPDDRFALWRTRWGGLLRSTPEDAAPFATDTGYPVSVLAAAPDGGVWAGYHFHGLTLLDKDGHPTRWTDSDGLPNNTILDVSQLPDTTIPSAWVATNNGAALVGPTGVQTIQPTDTPGPVDAVVALPDGAAYLAFNPIDPALYLSPDLAAQAPRRVTLLRHVDAQGKLGEPIALARGEVLDMALDADGETVWVGTTAGLYRLKAGALERVSARGRLQAEPVRRVALAPDGQVWMGIDRKGADAPAAILGYDPVAQDIFGFSVDDGLPSADRIDMLGFLPDGRLAVMTKGMLLRSEAAVFVPLRIPWPTIIAVLAVTALLGAALAWVLARRRQQQTQQRALEGRYQPLILNAERFFTAVGLDTRRVDYRTLSIAKPAKPTDRGVTAPGTLLRCADQRLVGSDEVGEFAASLEPPPDGGVTTAYLLYAKDLDPEARWRLDSLRLRRRLAIIPLSLPFVTRALAQGPDQAREALDSVRRSYLSRQDLFDMRKALDEPAFFFGRRSLIAEITDGLARSEHIAVVGQRKIGKTSLLNMLTQYLDRVPIAMLDMQSYARDQQWPGRVFHEVIRQYDAWGQSRFDHRWRPKVAVDKQGTGADFKEAMIERHQLQSALGAPEALVVVLDEMERVFPRAAMPGDSTERLREKTDEAWRYIEATGALRALAQHRHGNLLSLIVADRARWFNRVNHFELPGIDTNPFYQLFVEKFVTSLSEEECTRMLKDIGHAMGTTVSDELCDAIFHDSGGYPRLARLLASAAYQNRGDNDDLGMEQYQVGLDWLRDEDGGVDDFISENLWQEISASERIILAAYATETGSALETPANDDLDSRADSTAASDTMVVDGGLSWARRHLRSTGLLEEVPGGLRVRGALIRAWLRDNVAQ